MPLLFNLCHASVFWVEKHVFLCRAAVTYLTPASKRSIIGKLVFLFLPVISPQLTRSSLGACVWTRFASVQSSASFLSLVPFVSPTWQQGGQTTEAALRALEAESALP